MSQPQPPFPLMATAAASRKHSADTSRLLMINPPARQRRLLVSAYHLAVTLIFPVVAVFAAVIYPAADFRTRTLTISCVELPVKRGRETNYPVSGE